MGRSTRLMRRAGCYYLRARTPAPSSPCSAAPRPVQSPPLLGVRVATGRVARDVRLPYGDQDLRTIFLTFSIFAGARPRGGGDEADYERLHMEMPSKLHGVARIQSRFTLRTVVCRTTLAATATSPQVGVMTWRQTIARVALSTRPRLPFLTGRGPRLRAWPSRGGRPCSPPGHTCSCPCRNPTSSCRHVAFRCTA